MSAHAPWISERRTPTGTVYLVYCQGCSPVGRPIGRTKHRDKALGWVDHHRAQHARRQAKLPRVVGPPPRPAVAVRNGPPSLTSLPYARALLSN